MLTPNDCLVVVDVQKDFCPGGRLAVETGDEVVPVLNQWIAAADNAGATIVMSRDWHPPGHMSFQSEGGQWPEHCVQRTDGADFHDDLDIPDVMILVSKGQDRDAEQYSALDHTGLIEELRQRGIERLWVGGLAQDVCVRQTVLDGLKAGFEVHVIKSATRPVTAEGGRKALQEMKDAGAIVEEEIQV